MLRLAACRSRIRILPRLWALRALLWLGCIGSAQGEDQSPLAKRLFKEAPRAWARYKDFYLTLEGKVRGEIRVRSREGKWQIKRVRASWKQFDSAVLDESETFEAGSWNGRVDGENSEYAFTLIRKSDSKPWVIQNVEKRDGVSTEVWNSRKEECQYLSLTPLGPPLPFVFLSKGFRCVRVEPESMNGEELVRLTFTYVLRDASLLKGGWVVLDPSQDWMIRRGEIEVGLGEKVEGTAKWTLQYDYKEGSNHHPLMTRSVVKGKFWQKGRLVVEKEYLHDLDMRERPSIPESEFTLSAYGLPEPHWARPKKTRRPWYLWLAVGGIACLALGAGAGWYKRRRAAAGH
jgi:hypothetical protein